MARKGTAGLRVVFVPYYETPHTASNGVRTLLM